MVSQINFRQQFWCLENSYIRSYCNSLRIMEYLLKVHMFRP